MALIISLPLLVCLCAFEKKKWNKRRKPFDSVNRFKLHLVLPQSGKNKIWRCAVANLWRDVIVEKCYQKQFKKLRLKQDCLQDREWETVKRKKKLIFRVSFFQSKVLKAARTIEARLVCQLSPLQRRTLEEVCHGFNAKSKRRREKKENVWDAFRSPSGIGSIREKNRKRGGENAKDTAPPIPHQSIVLGWHCGLLNR